MNGKVSYLRVLIGFLVLVMAVPPGSFGQGSGGSGAFRQEELDQMLAPIALYPDSLLAQILVAATFPNEVMEADQWVKQNQDLRGDELNAALDKMDWDLSVKALVPFPRVLSMMSEEREWTQRLGEAFLAQQSDVMGSVQRLRAQAYAQGNLKSTDQQRVIVRGESIEIEPANPRLVYVPTYNPSVIYGSWGYPAYPPYAYNPYYPNYTYDPNYTGAGLIAAGVLGFAAGIAVGSAWHSGWGHWDWRHHHIRVNSIRTVNINRNIRVTKIRTTDLGRVVHHRRTEAAERAVVRTPAGRGEGAKTPAASVQRDLKQREGKAQAQRVKKSGQGGKEKVRLEREQVRRDKPLEKSRGDGHRKDGSHRGGKVQD